MGDNWYAFYPGDYARDTASLSLAEDGAYRRLLDHVYSTGEPLPESIAACCRICRAMTDEERAAVATVAGKFFPAGRNRRADREIVIREEQKRRLSEAGKEGNRRRWGITAREFLEGLSASPPDSQPDSGGNREAIAGRSQPDSGGDRKPTATATSTELPPPPPPPSRARATPTPPSTPRAAAAGSPPAQEGRAGGAPPAYSGPNLTVDSDLHERLLRIAPARFLAEVYPLLDARIGSGRPVANVAGYVTGAVSGRWGDVQRRGRAADYDTPKSYLCPECDRKLAPPDRGECICGHCAVVWKVEQVKEVVG